MAVWTPTQQTASSDRTARKMGIGLLKLERKREKILKKINI